MTSRFPPQSSSSSSSSPNYHRIQSFSDDLLVQIFLFLNASDLLQIERVNVLWHQVVQQKDTVLWKYLTSILWDTITVNRAKEINVLTKIEQLSLSLLKKSLVGIDLSRCVEKKDYQRMLLARLLYYPVMAKELKGSDPRFAGKYLSMFYPEWSLTIPAFKASYFYARKEIVRKEINLPELCQIDWIFKFKHHPNYVGPNDDENEDGGAYQGGWRCKFNQDYTMSSSLHGEEYDWRFLEGPDGITRIQVASYPPLTSYRLSDGSWGLENAHVYFRQRKSLDVDEIPITANTLSK